METIYYLTLLVLTALGSSIMTSYAPAMLARLKRVFTRTKRTPSIYCDDLQHQINELKEQMNNIAKTHYNRDKNTKQKIRNEVNEYLQELRK